MESKFKLPTAGQLKLIPSVLSKKEKIAIVFLILVLSGFFIWKLIASYLEETKIVPITGGAYIEGMVGAPQYINPVLSRNNNVDDTISKLIYSSLFRYDTAGNRANDLVESYKISDDGKTYEINLKKNVTWYEYGKPLTALTADDVVYTASVIKDPNYQSPLRGSLEGMDFEKTDDYNLTVKTKTVFGQTLNALTFGILPKHIWEKVNPENFTQALFNLKPIGSGFYSFENFAKDESGKILYYQLKTNENYYGQKPFMENIVFKFYPAMNEAIAAYNKEEITAIGGFPAAEEAAIDQGLGKLYEINIPQYFAVFFNQNKSKPLSDKIVRTALSYAVDKKRLTGEVFKNKAIATEGPYLPYLPGYNPNTKIYDFAEEHAKNILDAQGWKDGNNDGIREKDGVVLELTLLTGDNPELSLAAKMIGEMWLAIGAKANIKVVPLNELTNNYIRLRDYDALLFGEVLSLDPNPFAFWHSSQRKDPGLNLAVYSNKDADKILEEAQTLIDPAPRAEKYKQFQELVIEDVPAVFLYSPFYLYAINNKIKDITIKTLSLPSERLNDSNIWFMKTDRVKK